MKYILTTLLITTFWTNARGQTNIWIAGTGKWEEGTNWSSAGPPFNGEDVFITNATTKTVTIDTNTTADSAFSLTIGSLRLTAPTGVTNTLKVINADSFPLLMNTLLVGAGGSMLISNTVLGVAISNTISNGHLLVLNTTSFPSTMGATNFTFLVTGSSATFSNSGPAAFENTRGASVIVTNGARLDADDLYIGFKLSNVLLRADSNVFTVTGPNSQFNSRTLGIGEVGSSNRFIVGTGAVLHVRSVLRLGSTANTISNILQVLPGGTLNVGDSIIVANTNGAAAVLSVAGGLSTLASNLLTASFANSTGAVNVTGGQLVISNGVIGIGNSGTIANGSGAGRLTVTNGTLVTSKIFLGNSAGTRCDLVLADGGVISDEGCPSGTNCLMVINSLGFSDTNGTVDLCATPVQIGVTGAADGTVSGGTASYQYLYTGYKNIGTFTLAGGTVNICAQFDVGTHGPDMGDSIIATGAVWMTGGQLTMNSQDSIVGDSGVGQMSISNGTVLAAKLTVGNSTNASSFGTLTLAGGTVTTTTLVLPNAHSRFNFTGGQLNALGITNSSGQLLTLGNGASPITLNLMGGISSFGTGLKISTNATLSGFGTINGTVVNFGLISPSNTVLTFTGGNLTNNGTIRAAGAVIEAFGTVVNNGTIDIINGATNFHSTFINNGTVLDARGVRVTSTTISGSDVTIQIPSVSGHTYQLQVGGSLTTTNWVNSVASQPGTGGVLSFTEIGGATNTPPRFYRFDVTAP